MTLWNIIRDFFVQNIFGGTQSSGGFVNGGRIGQFFGNGVMVGNAASNNFAVYVGEQVYTGSQVVPATHINFADWLSTTFTVITLILLVFFLFLFVKWIFKLFAGLLSH